MRTEAGEGVPVSLLLLGAFLLVFWLLFHLLSSHPPFLRVALAWRAGVASFFGQHEEARCLQRLGEAVRYAEARGWKLDGKKVRRHFRACSPRSRKLLEKTAVGFGLVFSGGLGALFLAAQKRMRTVPGAVPKQAPSSEAVRAFVSALEKYVPQHVIEAVLADPSPENLRDCFLLARQKVNIAPNVLARLFPPGSPERTAVLLAEVDVTTLGGEKHEH